MCCGNTPGVRRHQMEILPNEKAKWIRENLMPMKSYDFKNDFKLEGYTIANCIPIIFESYRKIFHPFEITFDETDFLELSPDFFVKRKEYKSKRWEEISWKSISDKYGLKFHDQINPQTFINKFEKIGFPKNLTFPFEGHLSLKIFEELIKILKSYDTKDEVYSYQVMPHSEKNEFEVLVKCSFDELITYYPNGLIGYLYSHDKRWILFTDTDLCFTIFGGPSDLSDKLNSSSVESLLCLATSRVDDYGDLIN